MILHCVFCQFGMDVHLQDRQRVLQELSAFAKTLDGVISFEFGPNRDFEGKSPAYSDGFVIRFRDQQSLQAYEKHPTHQELGAGLCDICEGGADGIIVFDLEDTQA